MGNLTKTQKEKLKLSLELLCDSETTIAKVKKISQLLKGINPKMDKKVEEIWQIVGKIQQVQGGDVIGLSAEKLPEDSDKQKHVKKLVLLLLTHWKELQSEVARISEMQAAAAAGTTAVNQASVVKAGKIAATMKGPLGAITIVAAGVVAVSTILNNNATTIAVQNNGCGPLGPFTSTAINIPGLSLPSEAIFNGKSEDVKLPAIKATVDMTSKGEVRISALKLSQTINLPYEITDIILDGESLYGNVTEVDLGNAKNHELVIKCK